MRGRAMVLGALVTAAVAAPTALAAQDDSAAAESAAGSSPIAGGTSSQLPLTGSGVSPLAGVGGILLILGLVLRLPAVRDRLSLL